MDERRNKMKNIETIKEEITNIESRMSETLTHFYEGIYDEETYKAEMTRLESARNTLLWVLK